MRYALQVEVTLVGRLLLNLKIVGNNTEIVWRQCTNQADACHEIHLNLGRERTQRLAMRQVNTLDWNLDALFGEYVGMEHYSYTFRNNFHVSRVSKFAVDYQRVTETYVVERFAIDDAYAIQLFARGIDIYAVGVVDDMRDEVELFGNDAAS